MVYENLNPEIPSSGEHCLHQKQLSKYKDTYSLLDSVVGDRVPNPHQAPWVKLLAKLLINLHQGRGAGEPLMTIFSTKVLG
jgi:hypothetical protein